MGTRETEKKKKGKKQESPRPIHRDNLGENSSSLVDSSGDRMASKIIAQMIIQGTAIFSRAFFAAYQQALHNAKSGGAAAAGGAAMASRRGKMHTDEALKILNLEGDIKTIDIKTLQAQYMKFFEANDPKKGGSFYLQSKIYRAKEAIEHEINANAAPSSTKDDNTNSQSETGSQPKEEEHDRRKKKR